MVIILADQRGARLIHEVVLKNPPVTVVVFEKRKKNTSQVIDKVDLNMQKDKTQQDDNNNKSKRKNLIKFDTKRVTTFTKFNRKNYFTLPSDLIKIIFY